MGPLGVFSHPGEHATLERSGRIVYRWISAPCAPVLGGEVSRRDAKIRKDAEKKDSRSSIRSSHELRLPDGAGGTDTALLCVSADLCVSA